MIFKHLLALKESQRGADERFMAQKQNELPTSKARMDKQGGFVIPAAFRQALGLKNGDDVAMQWKDEDIVITRAPRKRKTLRRRTAG